MRKLILKTEHLSELTHAELTAVAGGQELRSFPCMTGYYPTINYDCVEWVTSLLPRTD